jgi:hypothetical protein
MSQPRKMVQTIVLLTYFREVTGSNLGWDISCFYEYFRGFPQSLQVNNGLVPQVRPLLHLYKCFQVFNSLIILFKGAGIAQSV